MASRAYVRVHNTIIAQMFFPTGEIGQFSKALSESIQAESRRLVHKRSGALRGSIFTDRIGSNQYHSKHSVYTNVPYAPFVHDGTTGPIRSRVPGKAMVLYQGPRLVPGRWAHTHGWLVLQVKGQKGQKFLERGMRSGMRKHGLL